MVLHLSTGFRLSSGHGRPPCPLPRYSQGIQSNGWYMLHLTRLVAMRDGILGMRRRTVLNFDAWDGLSKGNLTSSSRFSEYHEKCDVELRVFGVMHS